MAHVIEVKNLSKVYQRGSEKIAALKEVSFSIKKGEIVAVIGPSGSGKTTLVNLLGCLDNPTSGSLSIEGREIFKSGLNLSEKELTRIRRQYFGYVFQKFFLIPTLTVRENILLPAAFTGAKPSDTDVAEIMDMLGIKHRQEHLPSELSGGEMQRVAIARALISNPSVLIADEPTGNLDTARTEEIKALLKELNVKKGITIILVTHNPDLTTFADTVLSIVDGAVTQTTKC